MEDNQLKVLVVDDNEDDIFLVKEMIKEELPESDITLDYATTSDDAIALINSGGHDICLLDLHLEKEDGLALLKYLNIKNNFAPVILLTAREIRRKRLRP